MHRTEAPTTALVIEHLWIARAVAARYRHRGEDADDLYQVACQGLVEAALRFEADRGDFASFALPTVAGTVKRYFRDHTWMVRPARHSQELIARIRRLTPDLTQELGGEPSDAALAERLDEDVAAIGRARLAAQGYYAAPLSAVSDAHQGSDGKDAAHERIDARLIVDDLVGTLSLAERRLVWMRYYEELSQADIAAELGCSQAQVSRQLARLLERMRGLVQPEAA